MRTFGKVWLICTAVVIAGMLCFGCASGSSGANGGSAHPKKYYEGFWLCSSYEQDGETVSFDKLNTKQKKTFPYLVMDLDEDYLATVIQIENGDGSPSTLLMGQWQATDSGVRIDNVEFVLEKDQLVSQQEDRLLFFEKCSPDANLNVGTITYKGITFDAPIDLAYMHDAISTKSDNYGIASSYRNNAPTLIMSSTPTKKKDITDFAEKYADYGGSVKRHKGINFYVYVDKKINHSSVDFVSKGKMYHIDFSYAGEESGDYSEYAETFYSTIKISGKSSAKAAAKAKQKSKKTIPSGAISWKQASGHIGETVTIYGKVKDAEYASESSGQPTFIDLGAAYPDDRRVTIVVWGEDRDAFPEPPENMYEGKKLVVTGEIYLYNDVCNIKVTSPGQIQEY